VDHLEFGEQTVEVAAHGLTIAPGLSEGERRRAPGDRAELDVLGDEAHPVFDAAALAVVPQLVAGLQQLDVLRFLAHGNTPT